MCLLKNKIGELWRNVLLLKQMRWIVRFIFLIYLFDGVIYIILAGFRLASSTFIHIFYSTCICFVNKVLLTIIYWLI